MNEELEINISNLKCFYKLLDYIENTGVFLQHIGDTLETIIENFAMIYDVNIKRNIPIGKTELELIISSRVAAYIIECKLIETLH